ncbi:MAG: uracil-DNA glycosylase [Pseudomonadota bacterium]
MSQIKMHGQWLEHLKDEFECDYMQRLRQFLVAEKAAGKVIYPHSDNTFAAYNETPFESVKVVILGQDPYHGPGQAHGLCFSVQQGVPLPPSLKNIYKEIEQELDLGMGPSGHLLPWARQGVFLLNSVLSVEAGQAASHQGRGWETFTDRSIELLNEKREGLVFLLWGSHAQKKGRIIDSERHLVLKAPHPSPLSAHRGFFGCGHFAATNRYLESRGLAPVDWQIGG